MHVRSRHVYTPAGWAPIPSPPIWRPSSVALAAASILCVFIAGGMVTLVFSPRAVLLWALAFV